MSSFGFNNSSARSSFGFNNSSDPSPPSSMFGSPSLFSSSSVFGSTPSLTTNTTPSLFSSSSSSSVFQSTPWSTITTPSFSSFSSNSGFQSTTFPSPPATTNTSSFFSPIQSTPLAPTNSSAAPTTARTGSVDLPTATIVREFHQEVVSGKDAEQKTSTPAEEEGVKSEGIQTSASENKDTEMITGLVNMSETEILNNGFKVPLGVGGLKEAKESMEKAARLSRTRILRGIAHNPHFTPLQSYSKRAREKMIAGWDEIFEETIDQIQSLTADTFSSNVDELLKTIAELENTGYNVAGLKKRVEELTDVMNMRDSSEAEIFDLRASAEDYKNLKKKIENVMADLQAHADTAQVVVDELMDQVEKMEVPQLAGGLGVPGAQ